MSEVEIGIGKFGRRGYGFDEITIVPTRRTRDPEDVDISWDIDAFHFQLPLMASAMDAVVSPTTAIDLGLLGAVGVLNLEGLWTRYEHPESSLEELSGFSAGSDKAILRMQEIYSEPINPELIVARIQEIKSSGVTACAAVTPQRAEAFRKQIIESEPDILVIQGTVVSAEHVSSSSVPLDLKRFIRELDIPVIVGGCASYRGALHLMRTGAAGVLVGVGPGNACTSRAVLGVGVPQATAIADAAGARMRHLDETGAYCHVIADGGMSTGGDIAKAIACGADAVMIGAPLAAAEGAPGRGWHWGMATFHPTLPRGARVWCGVRGGLQEILLGPARESDGRLNLVGALRSAIGMCGYGSIKEFQNVEIMVAPAVQSEGKQLQHSQHVGMGAAHAGGVSFGPPGS